MVCIEARGLRKMYGSHAALNGLDLRVDEGRIVGLVGRNGAGKTTALNAILGLTPHEGELQVLGRDPWRHRDLLMREACFMTDIAVLPRWLRVSQLLDYLDGVHPAFDRTRAEALLAKSTVGKHSKIGALSKGMVTQLHLAIVMSVGARLLVLDEPTLGLDLLYRKQFFDTLLNEYIDENRTILITTHQVEEVEQVLTDVVFIDQGRTIFSASMDEIETRHLELSVSVTRLEAARALNPVHERQSLGWSVLLFDGVERSKLEALGEVRTPSISDLFVAMLGSGTSRARGAAQ